MCVCVCVQGLLIDKLLYIPNDTQNYPLCRLQLVLLMFGTPDLIKQPLKFQ